MYHFLNSLDSVKYFTNANKKTPTKLAILCTNYTCINRSFSFLKEKNVPSL